MPSTLTQPNLDALLPYGLLATRPWLLAQGVAVHTLDNWVKSRKLLPLARGVFARTGVVVPWQGVVASLNRMADQPVYVGGLSALEESGLGHYVTSRKTIHLYASVPRPGWLNKLGLDTVFEWHNSAAVWGDAALVNNALRVVDWREGLPGYPVALPEQAYMELLLQVPGKISFEHAGLLMQGSGTLSPARVDSLLLACKSVKVKRLFLWFARQQAFAWYKKLVVDSYDLGSGNRAIAKGGKLDTEFLITVPDIYQG